jgi:hypothetical protein
VPKELTMRVILKRGPKGDREFPHESRQRAWQRAESLGWLHAVEPKYVGEDLIEVDASVYYADPDSNEMGAA